MTLDDARPALTGGLFCGGLTMGDPIYDELSDKERAVLQGIWDGLSNAELASKLTVSVKTVEFHRGNILKRWRCPNMIAACRLGVQRLYLKA